VVEQIIYDGPSIKTEKDISHPFSVPQDFAGQNQDLEPLHQNKMEALQFFS